MAVAPKEVDEMNLRLGIDLAVIAARGLPYHPEAQELVSIGPDILNREVKLTPQAAFAWQAMQAAAAIDNIKLLPVSGYRSYEQQIAIIERKLARGDKLETILAGSAPPGYSEHHSGRAIDIATLNSPPLIDAFELTDAYAWLTENAALFQFSLSFPRDNRYGYVFEPWHWFHQADDGTTA
jgi:zinc D-Ala-D-Ala carboxypeptidase